MASDPRRSLARLRELKKAREEGRVTAERPGLFSRAGGALMRLGGRAQNANLRLAAGIAERVGVPVIDAGLATTRGAVTAAVDPFDRGFVDEIIGANIRRGAPRREAAMDEAIEGAERRSRERGTSLAEPLPLGPRAKTGADLAGLLGVAGDVVRETAFGVPSVIVGGVPGRLVVGAAGKALRLQKLAARLNRTHPASRVVSPTISETAKAVPEFAGFGAVRETIEEGTVNERVGEVARHSIVSKVTIPEGVPVIGGRSLWVPWFALGGAPGFVRGGKDLTRHLDLEAELASARPGRTVGERTIASDRPARMGGGVEHTPIEQARREVQQARAMGARTADVAERAIAESDRSVALTTTRQPLETPIKPLTPPRRPSEFGPRDVATRDKGFKVAERRGEVVGAEPVTEGGPARTVSVRDVGGRSVEYEVRKASDDTGILMRDGKEFARTATGRPSTLVLGRETTDNPELLTSIQTAMRKLRDERGFATFDSFLPEADAELVKRTGQVGGLEANRFRTTPRLLEGTEVTHLGFKADLGDLESLHRVDVLILPGEEIRMPAVMTENQRIYEGAVHLFAYEAIRKTQGLGVGTIDGFTTTMGRFVSRRTAGRIGEQADQLVVKEVSGSGLDALDLKRDIPDKGEAVRATLVRADKIPPEPPRPQTIRAYHGTTRTFDRFEPENIRAANVYGEGFYFSESPEAASRFATPVVPGGDVAPNVRPVDLRIRNPFDVFSREHADRVWAELGRTGRFEPPPGEVDLFRALGERTKLPTPAIRAAVERSGFDGIVSRNTRGNTWVAFDKEQVRAALVPGERGFITMGDPERAAQEVSAAAKVRAVERDVEAGLKGQAVAPKGRIGVAAQALGRRVGQSLFRGAAGSYWRESFHRVQDWARKDLGAGGARWASEVQTVRDKALTHRGTNFQDARKVMRDGNFSREEMREAARHVHGYKENPPQHIASLIEGLRPVFDRGLNTLRDAGFKRFGGQVEGALIEGTGKFLPLKLNKKGQVLINRALADPSHPEVSATIKRMVESGAASDETAALRILQSFHERNLNADVRYFTKERHGIPEEFVDMDFMEWAEDWFFDEGLYVEGFLKWGRDSEGALPIFQQIREQVGPNEADLLQLHHQISFGLQKGATSAEKTVMGAVANYLTAARLSSPLLPIRQVGQRIINTTDMPFRVTGRLVLEMPPVLSSGLARSIATKAFRGNMPPFVRKMFDRVDRLADEARRSGAVQAKATAAQDVMTGMPGESAAARVLRMTGFMQGEEGNQIFTAIAAKRSLEHWVTRYLQSEVGQQSRIASLLENVRELTIPGFQGGAAGKYQRAIERMTKDKEHGARVIDDFRSGKGIADEDMQAVMIMANTDRNFALDLLTKPVHWDRSPVFRVLLKFKPFMAKQFVFMWKHIYAEALRGNLAPVAKSIPAALLMAELYNIPRDLLFGRQDAITTKLMKDPRSLDEPSEIFSQIVQHQIDAATIGLFSDLVWGWDNFAFGVGKGAVGSAVEFGADVGRRLPGRSGADKQAISAFVKFVEREVPMSKAMMGAARRANQWLDIGYNPEYRRIRGNVISYAGGLEQTPFERIAEIATDVERGREGFAPTDRTLLYSQAWERATLGHIDDASEYLAAVMEEYKTPAERKAALRSISGSLRRVAPLGELSHARDWESNPKVRAYLESLSSEERARVVETQRRFIRDGQETFRRAKIKAEWSK